MEYEEFLKQKQVKITNAGFDIDKSKLNPMLWEHQKDIVKWALKKGRAAVFAATGMGKTKIFLEWSKHVLEYTNGSILIVSPLGVAYQSINEAIPLGITVKYVKTQDEIIGTGIFITNYERLDNFNPNLFAGIALDESSILKGFTGKTTQSLIDEWRDVNFRLACTATPAPNDFMELGTHSEFLGEMKRFEMLAMFFIHDAGDTAKWRLKGHAEYKFWEWVASWACVLTKPSDLGYSDDGFELPKLHIEQITVESNGVLDDTRLFNVEAKTLTDRRDARRSSLDNRVVATADIINFIDDYALVWCDLNSESDSLKKSINECYEVKGSDDFEYKEKTLLNFANGKIKRLVSKPSIAGHGLNLQHCNVMAFTGLSDSFEQFYQAVRRCWRTGQKREVYVYIVTSKEEGLVVENIKRKEKDFERMQQEMVKYTKRFVIDNLHSDKKVDYTYKPNLIMELPNFIGGQYGN